VIEVRGSATVAAPLSVAQEAVWYTTLFAPNQISYNETVSIRKDGPFDVDALRQAFNELVRRHEAWRTTFDVLNGEAVQVVHRPPHFELPVLDLSHLDLEDAEAHTTRVISEVSRVPYDLRRGPLLRPRLVRFAREHHRLYLAIHHAAFDGVSLYRVAFPELVALYDAFSAGRPSPLDEPTVRYTDYAAWEQEWITSARAARRLAFWREHLAGCPVVPLPLDHPRPQAQRFRGRVAPLRIPRETVAELRAVAQATGATLFQVLAAAWALLLGRYSGQDDVAVATAADLRQRPEFEAVVGYSITPLVLRIDLAGAPSFAELVVRVRNELLDGLDNLVPFERIVRELGEKTRSSANPIYQSLIVFEPPMTTPDPEWSIHLMETEIGDAVGGARLDLELQLDERPEGHLAGRLIYDGDLFDPSSARRIVDHFVEVIGSAASDASVGIAQVPAISPADRRALEDWNATTTEGRVALVHQLVEAQALHRPDAPALSAAGDVLTYGELNERADQAARRLRTAGVSSGDVVAFCSEPTPDLVTAILGALKAGAAYLLLDPTLPVEDLESMVGESGASVVYADPPLAARLSALSRIDPEEREAGNAGESPSTHEGADAICCLSYAPGPDGWHGISMRHRSVSNLATAMAADLGISAEDTVLALRPTVFESSAFELWVPLGAGAKLVLAPPGAESDGAVLSALATQERVSFLHATAQRWQGLIDTGLKAARGLVALCGGAVSDELAGHILERCRVLFCAYGSPETTLYATLGRVEPSIPATVGRPIANVCAHVVDGHGELLPVGAVGALVIGGAGVSEYLDRDDLSARAFVPDPCGPGVAFVTGDRARWRASGRLELLSLEQSLASAAALAR